MALLGQFVKMEGSLDWFYMGCRALFFSHTCTYYLVCWALIFFPLFLKRSEVWNLEGHWNGLGLGGYYIGSHVVTGAKFRVIKHLIPVCLFFFPLVFFLFIFHIMIQDISTIRIRLCFAPCF